MVGAGLSEGTGAACGMTKSGWTHGVVDGLASWLAVGTTERARALKPSLGTNIPPAVRSPILNRSRRLVNPAAISSRRFLAAFAISRYRAAETFSPSALKYMRRLPLNSSCHEEATDWTLTSCGDENTSAIARKQADILQYCLALCDNCQFPHMNLQAERPAERSPA